MYFHHSNRKVISLTNEKLKAIKAAFAAPSALMSKASFLKLKLHGTCICA